MAHADPSQPQPQWQHPNARVQTEWQRFSSPPLPQDPTQQPAPQPRPPIKKARGGLLITIGAVVIMLALLGFAFGLQNRLQSAPSRPATSTKHLQQPTPTISTVTPLPVLAIQAIGKPVVVDSTWTVTVNSVKTSSGDQFSTPRAGDVYLVVDVTVKNTSRQHQDMLSGNQIVLRDSTGQQYTESITDFATPPDGTIMPGHSQRGQLAYEVPATLHNFFYFFQADANGTDMMEWALHV